jgi:DNA-nicking Smr family endonuclease
VSKKTKIVIRDSFSQLNSLIDEAGIRLKSKDKPILAKPAPPRLSPLANALNNCTDEDLFIQSMGGIQRVDWRRSPHPSSKSAPATPDYDREAEDLKLMQAAVDKNAPMEILDHPEYIEGWVGVGKRFLPNLRNGLYSIQGQIDLHGLSREESQKEVEEYIIRMSRFHSCCVKIIHGRGINSPADRATLKDALQNFLCTRKMSRYVVAFASAQFNDGGVGAVYVLLSRQ